MNDDDKRCECGQITGVYCDAVLDDDAVTVDYMPDHLRESHAAGGGSGRWPFNGALRLTMTQACLDGIAGCEVVS